MNPDKIKLMFSYLAIIFPPDGALYVIGGNEGLASVEVLNFDHAAEVPNVPNFPYPVSLAVAAFFNDEVLVCGGFDYPFTYYKDCYAIRTGGDTWEERPQLNFYRKGVYC